MIDGFKCEIRYRLPDGWQKALCLKRSKTVEITDCQTGELRTVKQYEYNGLFITDKTIEGKPETALYVLHGSFHRLANEGG